MTEDPEWAHLEQVRQRVLERLPKAIVVEKALYVPISVKEIETYVFYPTDKDVAVHAQSGATDTVQRLFEEELDRVQRGPASGTLLRFEFDSAENIRNNFRGNFHLRLR